MIKYAKVINELGQCDIASGTNEEFYKSIGMSKQDVEQSEIDNQWYLAEKCPHKSEEERLQQAKTQKYKENDNKAETARISKVFTMSLQNKECEFDTKTQTQTDLLTAFAVCSQGGTYNGWVCDNGTVVDLTLEDVISISAKFKELSNIYPHWNYFKKQIDNAKSLSEVELITIDYSITLSEEMC